MCVCFFFLLYFFFQAEDGIRDLVRSRGLGDVYKRQAPAFLDFVLGLGPVDLVEIDDIGLEPAEAGFAFPADGGCLQRTGDAAVSYTHLTLPTSDLV